VHVLFGGGRSPSDDKESVLAYTRAYNDWLSEFCSYAPDRLFGPAAVPPTGLDDAIAEAERVAGMTGICGLVLNSWPAGSHSFPRPDEDERFWSVAEDLDLAVMAHVGLGGDGEADESSLQGLRDPRTRFPWINKERMAVEFVDITSHLILGGVLDRHPNLRFGCIESGIGWVPFFLEQTEDNWSRHRFWANSMLSMRPSDFWNRQCFVTFQIDHFGMANRDAVGIDTIMWSSDYPHSGAEWPDSQRIIDDHFRGVSADDTRKILCDNAARLYGLDVEKLGRFGVPKFTPAGTAA
jgi:predicted TIM-barrel fold metal-dependent hydrolase